MTRLKCFFFCILVLFYVAGADIVYVASQREKGATFRGAVAFELLDLFPTDESDNVDLSNVKTWKELEYAVETANNNGGGVITLTSDIVFGASISDETLPVIIVPLTIHGQGRRVDAATTSMDERPVFQIEGSNADVIFEDLTISGGYALFGGGGVSVEDGSINLIRCRVINNYSEVSGGGGICVRNGMYARFEDCEISDNEVIFQNSGGGIYFEGSSIDTLIVFKNCKIADNRALGVGRGGGGVYVYRGFALFDNCQLFGNTTAGPGGGLHIMDGRALFRNSQIDGNEADEGAGLYFIRSDAEIYNCVISGNHTNQRGRGGGILFNSLMGDLSLRMADTQVSENTCGYVAGGIYVEMGRTFFNNVTVTNNMTMATFINALAAGMYVPAPTIFKNTTVKNNNPKTYPDLYLNPISGGNFKTFGGNDIGSVGGRLFPQGGNGDKIAASR